jgi:hypothetical protein
MRSFLIFTPQRMRWARHVVRMEKMKCTKAYKNVVRNSEEK